MWRADLVRNTLLRALVLEGMRLRDVRPRSYIEAAELFVARCEIERLIRQSKDDHGKQ